MAIRRLSNRLSRHARARLPGARNLLMAAGFCLAGTTALPAFAQSADANADERKLWSQEVRDFALESLDNADALSVAAIPLNGPGIKQYVNADELMSPGSIMKLVTTYAALELLGPNHRWQTEFLTDGTLSGNTLYGNLYVRFGGDPKLTIERLWRTLRDLEAMGITTIRGDLVLDGQHFRLDGFPPFEDSGDNPYRPFLVEPSAYLTNLNLVQVQVRADERGTRAWSTPALPDIALDNQVTATEEGPCPARRTFDWRPTTNDQGQVTLTISGSLPQGCRTSNYLSLLSHERYTASLIRSVLAETGVRLIGADRLAATPEDARLLLKTRSPDLVTMVRDINKWSSNVMARQLLLSIGAEHRQSDDQDDRVAGIRAIYDWLEDKDINTAGMVIDNGSGLSRHGRITARQGAQILLKAWNSPYASDLMASLPIIALDGTMARRLKNTGMDGRGRIKTGLLANVRSIAGYTRDENDTTWAIVGMVNNDPAWNGKAVLDKVLHSLHYRPPTGTAFSRSAATDTGSRIQ